jgi:hypothetical protein
MDLVISHPISWHLRRGGMGRVGGARRQALHRLRPRHRQRAGGGCSAEQWLPWSRAWTCCNGCCASSDSRLIGSHWKKSARHGELCSPCRQSADALWKHLTRMTFGPQVWTRSSIWIQVGNWLSEGGGWGWWLLVQPPVLELLNSESELNVTNCVAEIACVAHGGRLPQLIEGCSITAATTDGF